MKETMKSEAQAEFDVHLDFQTAPFVVAGDTQVIQELHKAVVTSEPVHNAVLVPKAVIQPPEQPQPTILEGRRASLHAKMYDMVNGSNMYQLLQEKRQQERDLAMAHRLGLITTDRCAKHEKQLAHLRGMQ